jgi:hypothetical protein
MLRDWPLRMGFVYYENEPISPVCEAEMVEFTTLEMEKEQLENI